MIRYVSGDEVLEKSAVDKMMDQVLSSDELKEVRKIERYSEIIADSLALVHGGDWQIVIDHQRRAVMIFAE